MLPIQTRYRKAIGKDLGEDEQKRVWKLHFVRQITIAEQTTIITFRSTLLEITEMREIENLMKEKFDEQVLQTTEAVHQIEQLFPNVQPGQKRHGLPEPALFLSPLGEKT